MIFEFNIRVWAFYKLKSPSLTLEIQPWLNFKIFSSSLFGGLFGPAGQTYALHQDSQPSSIAPPRFISGPQDPTLSFLESLLV